MPGVRDLHLPAWVPWCAQLIIVPLWSWLTYGALFSEEGRAELGLGNWVAVTFVLLVISLFLFLAGYRKLPGCVGTDGERHLSVGDR